MNTRYFDIKEMDAFFCDKVLKTNENIGVQGVQTR